MRKSVALDDAVDFVGVVFEERLENILDSIFHNPQRIKSRKELFVVCILLDELCIVYAHLFVRDECLVDLCNVDYEQNKNNSDQDKPDMEQVKLLARYAVLPCTGRVFRNNLDSVELTTHNFTINGCPLFPGFLSGHPWNNS
jgi:hypothetical protein